MFKQNKHFLCVTYSQIFIIVYYYSSIHNCTHIPPIIFYSELDSFSEFARDQVMQLPFMVPLPEEGSVFDYYLNLKQYQFVPWNERGGDTATRAMKSSGYVPLPEVLHHSLIATSCAFF